MQLKTICLNGVCAIGLIKSLIEAVNKLSEDVTQLKSDNMALKIQVQDLQGLVEDHCKCPRQQPQGSLSIRPSSESYKEAMDFCNVAPQQKSTRSYADVVNFATQLHNTKQAEESKQGSTDDGFILVTGRHKNDCAANKVSNQVSVASKKSRTPVFGVRNTTTLPVITKKAKHVFICVTLWS
jgi:hypothetical protein